MFTFETVPINVRRQFFRVGMGKYLLNEYIHFFLILNTCVKASSNFIYGSFCCVSNFTYKFIMRGGKKNLFGLTYHESQPGGHLVYQATMFSLQLCDLKWQQQHQNRRGRRLLGPQWANFPNPFGQLSQIQP